MSLTIRSVLLLIAVILFVLDALGLSLGGIDLIAIGLALFAAAFLVPDTALGGGGRGRGVGLGDRDGDGDLDRRR
jgi:hypothetical protein